MIKFPRFKKSSVRAIVQDAAVDNPLFENSPYRYHLTYGRSVDHWTYTLVFERRLYEEDGKNTHREIFYDSSRCSYEEMVDAYKRFIKAAKVMNRLWERENPTLNE